ncbi:hypothetical protein [Adlercreutzia sp. ZJ304]|uniref:YcjF family protein n=1 Tax=Adlercreutzia sp. ZJ304 TaxID=2709791 RepID=UPI0013EBF675|nr:hypothetical protein [Adlercreutzia sp. ZJ304]
MALPVDVGALLKAATNTEDAVKTPISVSVYIDDTAAGECVAFVRGLFAGATGDNARVSVSYIDEHIEPHPRDDMAVIVGGLNDCIGKDAASIRDAGVPVMVATTMPKIVEDITCANGYPIPTGDLISPLRAPSKMPFQKGGADAFALPAGEIIELTEDSKSEFVSNIGNWIIAACPDRKLAFAHAFPFVRRPLAREAITSTSLQNAGVGLLPIIPGADMPIMTLNQAKMLMQIAAVYGQPLDKTRLPELAALVGNAFLCRSLARSFAKAVPFAGFAISAAVGFAATEAVGRAAIEYFEVGGNAAGLANVVKQATGEAVDIAQKASVTPTGKAVIRAAKRGVKGAAGMVFGKAARR